jgi:N-acetylglucosaminyl-diphospho-decaprenol L-rhamnosyltransferase
VNATVVIPTLNGGERLERLLCSLSGSAAAVLVVDNASTDDTRDRVGRSYPDVEILTLPRNEGFSRAVNIAARHIDTDALVLLNDDCLCEPGFAENVVAALDPARSIVMAAGVLLERSDTATIDSAGIELDETLLVFDYLNGKAVDALASAAPPVGPSGAAAAYDRAAFVEAGGFDENLFAYWEDIDLALRLRLAGATCALAGDARAFHALSSTLGSGSSRKNFLTGFGRGYMLRKWSVVRPRRLLKVVARDGMICAGQAIVDRNVAGFVGRAKGWHAAAGVSRCRYPSTVFTPYDLSLRGDIMRRLARRRRIESGPSTE